MFQARPAYFVAALVIITVGAYLPLWNNQFVDFDDEHYLTTNPQVLRGFSGPGFVWAWTTFHGNYWQPITWLTFQFDAQFFSQRFPEDGGTILSPVAFHAQNLFWHVANTLLLFGLLRRLTGAQGRSFVVAALFAVHPMHVESVAWATERKDVLSLFFGLLTLWAYVRCLETPNWKWRLATLTVYFLSLASKPMLIALPFLLLLLDYWPLKRWGLTRSTAEAQGIQPRRSGPPWYKDTFHGFAFLQPTYASLGRLLVEKWPFFLLAAGIAFLTVVGRNYAGAAMSLGQISLSARVANALTAYAWYVASTFWPVNLAVMYPHPHDDWSWEGPLLGTAMILGITILAWWQAGRRPWLLVGWLWFLVSLLPVIGLTQGGEQAWADRFCYWPHIGLFVAVVWQVYDLIQRLRVPAWIFLPFASLIIIGLCMLTWTQTERWHDTVTLWEHATAVRKDNHLAHVHLGKYYMDKGRPAEAVPHFAEAVRIQADASEYHYLLGLSFLFLGKLNEANEQFKETLTRNRKHADAWHNMGIAKLRQGKFENAAFSFRKALELNPRSPDTLAGLGSALWRAGKKQEAAKAFRDALDSNPKEAQPWNGLGMAELAQGNLDRAIEFLAKAVQYNPHWPKAHSDLGLALVRKGQAAEGIKKHQTAVQLAEQGEQKLADMGARSPTPDSIPEIVLYRCRLAHGLHRLGYTQLAAEEYRAALKRDPQWPDKFTAKAWGLATAAKANVRDPLWGLELVEQACQAVSAPTATMLDTLATAQAALGKFPEAVQTAQRALAIASEAGNTTLANSIRDRLKLYQAGKLPWPP